MKGVLELNPPASRYSCIWDVSVVLKFLKTWHPLSSLNLKQLSLKLTVLVALVTAQRAQTIHLLNLDSLVKDGKDFVFLIKGPIKQSTCKNWSTEIILRSFPELSLCVVHTLKEYIKRTAILRNGENKLFISFIKPFRAVSKATISRWIKSTLQAAGINVKVFKAHSTRSAATSAAARNSCSIMDIVNTAGWANCNMFAKFYNKPLLKDSFANSLLKSGS